MKAMTEMARAIREVMEAHAPTLKELPGDVLDDFVQIVGAFHADLEGEQQERLRKALPEGEVVAVENPMVGRVYKAEIENNGDETYTVMTWRRDSNDSGTGQEQKFSDPIAAVGALVVAGQKAAAGKIAKF